MAGVKYRQNIHSTGSIEGDSLVKTGGTSSQFLKADGSVDSSTYLTAAGGTFLPLTAGSSYPLTGTLTGTSAILSGTINSGAITSTGQITGTEIEGTSLDINGDGDISGSLTVPTVIVTAGSNRTKLNVWSTSNTHGMGIGASYTFGGLNDYAVTFQTSDVTNRGFWWGDTAHTNAQGAMALTTEGKLTVASGIRVGYGESDVTTPAAGLAVSGDAVITGDVEASTITKTGGTSSQFLKADGSVDSNTYLTSGGASGDLTEIIAGTGLSGTSLTGPIPTLNVDAAQPGITSLGTLTGLRTGSIELNHATDTTIARVSAGVVSIEGKKIITEATNGWHGSVDSIKILPSDWIAGTNTGRPIMIQDLGSNEFGAMNSGDTPMYASVPIPMGFKAVGVVVFGSCNCGVDVYEAGVDTLAAVSKGSGVMNSPFSITNVTASHLNYILINVAYAVGNHVSGGLVEIQPV